MKHSLFLIILFFCLFETGCKKDSFPVPSASFNFRGDTTAVLKMATYDTCTLFNNSVNSDSSFWDLGNRHFSSDKNVLLTYSESGTYNVKLTVRNKDGQETSLTKKVIVLDRVLKKIIIKSVYWDTIPNNIPYFNAVWPTSSRADIFVRVQKFAWGDSVAPYSGIMPNSPIIYESPLIHNVAYNTSVPMEIDVAGKFIVDKKMVLDGTFAISLMAKDSNNVVYALQTSLTSGCSFGIQQENFPDNRFNLICNLFSAVEFDCQFE